MRKFSVTLTLLVLLSGFSCQRKTNAETEIRDVMLEFIEQSIAPGMGFGYYSDQVGTILLAVGEADVENSVPLEISTPYPIQSTTKMFMSILTLQLIEKGKLRLESTIDEWMDSVPNSNQITIRHLLTHTSGLIHYTRNSEFMGEYFSETEKEYTRNDLLHAGLEVSRDQKIGDKEYSNTNFVILANIIETITRQSIGQVLEHRIFRPAEMNHTYFKPGIIDDTTTTVKCYRLREAIDLDKWNFLANTGGGIVSTLEDMLQFAHWILDNHYLLIMARESELINLYASLGLTTKYGLGIEVDDQLYGVKMVGHSGGNPGLIHEFRISPETGEILVYYLNEGKVGKPYGDFMKDLEGILQKHR